jgi:ribosomal protein S14
LVAKPVLGTGASRRVSSSLTSLSSCFIASNITIIHFASIVERVKIKLGLFHMKKNIAKQKLLIPKDSIEKLIINNKILTQSLRAKAANQLHNKHSKKSIRKVCLFTGRSRAVIKKYRCSRIKFKELAEFGVISGIKKSS